MIDYEEAAALIAGVAKPREVECVPLESAHGRVLARPVQAQIDAPRCDVSAMDGYAVRDLDLGDARPSLRVVGEALPGRGYDGVVRSGECVRIFTGAPVPAGADRVILQEDTLREGEMMVVQDGTVGGRHVRAFGTDFMSGDTILPAGRLLDYRALVAAAGADLDAVVTWRRPCVTVLSTGDELSAAGTARHFANHVPESISIGVSALTRDWGGDPVERRRLPDDLIALRLEAANAVGRSDLVVVTGGASVGERDFAKAMFEPLGAEVFFSKVRIKPGKPVWFARVDDTLVLGLPGNPGAAMTTARIFLAPLIAGLSGRNPSCALAWRDIPLATPLPPCGDRETFVHARLVSDLAEPLVNQDSSAQSIIGVASLLLRRRPGTAAMQTGELVSALDL